MYMYMKVIYITYYLLFYNETRPLNLKQKKICIYIHIACGLTDLN